MDVTPSQHQRPREPESGLEAVHASEYGHTSLPEVYDHHQQGLEVCPSNPHHAYHDQGLEALPPNSHNYLYPVASSPHDGSQPQVYSAVGGRDEKAPGSTYVGPLAAGSQIKKQSLWRRKRKTLVIVGIVVAVVVIAAAVVGGVLGSQAAVSDRDDEATSSR